jgi:hypothetical protein
VQEGEKKVWGVGCGAEQENPDPQCEIVPAISGRSNKQTIWCCMDIICTVLLVAAFVLCFTLFCISDV